MNMKNKLHFKHEKKSHRKRIHWMDFIDSSPTLTKLFRQWLKKKERKIKSKNKLAYLFLLSYFGKLWIEIAEKLGNPNKVDEWVYEIAHTKWIQYDFDDEE